MENTKKLLTELEEVFKASCNALSALWSFNRSSLEELFGIRPRTEPLLLLMALTILDTRPFSVGFSFSDGKPMAFSEYFVGLCCGSTLCNNDFGYQK